MTHLVQIKTSVVLAVAASANVVIAAVERVNWGALGTGLAVAFIAFMQVWQQAQAKRREGKLNQVHQLVNSNFGAQLRITYLQAQRIANLTKDPQDAAVATEAHRLWEEHVAKQAKVDAQAAEKSK